MTYNPTFWPFLRGKTSFLLDGNIYHWKSSSSRLEDAIGRELASYDARFLETEEHVLGKLRVTVEGTEALGLDMIVVTALALWKREDENLQVNIPLAM